MSTPVPSAPSPLDLVRAYHHRTKHRYDAYANGPGSLDWDAQPAPFRHFAGAATVLLPRLASTLPGSPLYDALQRPFSALDGTGIAPLPPTLEHLGALLQLSLGITAWKSFGPDRWAVRANPSSGNLHPSEAYLLLGGIAGLADGLYHYRPEDHALECRATHPAIPQGLPRLAIVLTSIMWREAWKYGERAFRYCQLDTGHAVGALRYAAAVLGWRLAEQPRMGNATLARLSGIDRSEDFPCGRLADTETEEAELLLAVSFTGTPPMIASAAELDALAATARWSGSASPIDPHPMYRWPLIAEVARATRRQEQDDDASPPADLPAPTADPDPPATPTLQSVIGGRRSAQRFDPRQVMARTVFAALLAHLPPTQGLPWDALQGIPRIALVFFVHRVEGLAPGLYLLPRTPRLLAALRLALAADFAMAEVPGIDGLLHLAALAPTELQRIARSLHCHQDIAAHAGFALGMLAEFDAALAAGPAAYRSLYRECGLIGQVLYLAAEAHGLRGTGIGCFFDDPVHRVLGLEGTAWQTLYHFTVGHPIDDPRIETTPAYVAGIR